jgi:Domain of Unknown Function (DUF1080)
MRASKTVLLISSALAAVAACSDQTDLPVAPLPAPGGGAVGGSGTAGAGQGGATAGLGGIAGSSTSGATGGSGAAVSAGGAEAGRGGQGGDGPGGVAGQSGGSGGTGVAGGGTAGTAGSGGASSDGWARIFNGTDLTGWVTLIHKWKYNEDPYRTFRVNADTGVIRVTYDDYPGQNFDDHCGLLYYDKHLTNYRIRFTYRFYEPQAKNPVSWGKNNSGLMVFAIDPKTVTGDPEFPPLIEIQLIGTPSSGGKNNANLCQPGGMTVSELFGSPLSDSSCHDSRSGTAPPADQWVTIEAEVRADGETKVYQHPDVTKPVLSFSGPRYKGQAVTGGYLAFQSESQPIEYKDIELKELP